MKASMEEILAKQLCLHFDRLVPRNVRRLTTQATLYYGLIDPFDPGNYGGAPM